MESYFNLMKKTIIGLRMIIAAERPGVIPIYQFTVRKFHIKIESGPKNIFLSALSG